MRTAALLAALATTACVAPDAAVSGDAAIPAGTEVAVAACRAALATTANRPEADITVTAVLVAEAGIEVTLSLVGAEEPWSCVSDAAGAVQAVMYLGEG